MDKSQSTANLNLSPADKQSIEGLLGNLSENDNSDSKNFLDNFANQQDSGWKRYVNGIYNHPKTWWVGIIHLQMLMGIWGPQY